MKTLSKEEIFELFEKQEKKTYKKKGRYLVRPAKAGETILTIVAGKLETIKKADKGDIVIRNIELGSSAETYIISEEKLKQRYILTPEVYSIDGIGWTVVQAQGRIEAFCYIDPDPFSFFAPWNEEMICYFEDYIARPVPSEPNDIYRIEKQTFDITYEEE